MTTDEIKRLLALAKGATPGPWIATDTDSDSRCYVWAADGDALCKVENGANHNFNGESDAAFIAAARTAVPDLCNALLAERARRERLEKELRKIAPIDEPCDDGGRRNSCGDCSWCIASAALAATEEGKAE